MSRSRASLMPSHAGPQAVATAEGAAYEVVAATADGAVGEAGVGLMSWEDLDRGIELARMAGERRMHGYRTACL